MINIVICDDDRILGSEIREILENNLKERKECFHIQYVRSGEEVLEYKEKIDLLFLDIEMETMDGFEVAHTLNKRKETGNLKIPKIIFLTNHDEVIKKAFHVKAFRFLTKDDFKEDIDCCIRDFIKEIQQEMIFEVLINNRKIKIKQGEIQYITAHHNGSEIWTESTTTYSDKSLEDWMNILDKERFVYCHKCNIVNLTYVDFFDQFIFLYNGSKVLFSRRKKTEFVKKYNQYIHNNGIY